MELLEHALRTILGLIEIGILLLPFFISEAIND